MPRGEKPVLFGDKCKKCGVILDESNASYKGHTIQGDCRDCYNKRIREWRKNNPERTAEIARNNNLKSKYGISKQRYDELMLLQSSGCAICKQLCSTGQELSVDHNHHTGEVRGLLCRKCNTLLSYSNEDEDLIWNMLEYLKHTTWSKKSA